MSQTLATFDKMLKEFYKDKVVETVNQNLPLLSIYKKRNVEEGGGRAIVYPVHTGRNAGRSAIAEGATLPTAGRQQYAEKRVPFKYNYGRIQLTAQAMKQSKSSKGAFQKAIDEEITRCVEDVSRDMNRQMWGFGNGILAYVNGAVTGAKDVVLKNPGGVTFASNGARYVAPGDIIAFLDPAALTAASAIRDVDTVASVDYATATITMAANVTVSDGDIIVRCPATTVTTVGETAYGNEVMGMLGHIDDGSYVSTYHNIDRTAYATYNSAVRNLGGAQLSLDDIQHLVDYIEQFGGGKIKEFWGHQSTRREYLRLLQSFRRYVNGDAKSPDGGFKGFGMDIEYGDIPVKTDRDAPYGMMFAVDPSGFYRYVVTEGQWADDDGKILLRTSADAYEGRFRIFDNYTNDMPNRCGVIRGISVTPDTVPYN